MIYSIYHFWKNLFENKSKFKKIEKLDKFPFPKRMLSWVNRGVFPDLAIKVNKQSRFSGGELVELKDSKVYNVSSFNSTIPTGRKYINSIVASENGSIFKQMRDAGDCHLRGDYHFGAQTLHMSQTISHVDLYAQIAPAPGIASVPPHGFANRLLSTIH